MKKAAADDSGSRLVLARGHSSALATSCATGGATACATAGATQRPTFATISLADGSERRNGPGGVRPPAAHTDDRVISLAHPPQGFELNLTIGAVILIQGHSFSPLRIVVRDILPLFLNLVKVTTD
jgi:hypothetical protein